MDVVGAKNLVDSPGVYEKLTPWEPPEILEPLATSKLNSLQLNNTRSKLPHWILKTHIAKCLARGTAVLTEWTMVNKRYDLYLPLEKLKVEIKYSWGTLRTMDDTKGTVIFTSLLAKTYPQRKLNA
ncbi:hypothetical protein [Thermococcus prieurii]